jgi:plasmid rolling circle replication initiator protein Rep
MANVNTTSQKISVRTPKSSDGIPCSNKETFDTSKLKDDVKPWESKRRRKSYCEILSRKMSSYELQLPKEERGSWNTKKAYEYTPIIEEIIYSADEFGELTLLPEDEIIRIEKINKYGEVMYRRTDIEKTPDAYYNLETNIGNQRRWMRMERCYSEIKEFTDRTTGEVIYKATFKCNDKLCANCSQIRSVVAVTKYKSMVESMENPVMLVLHQKSPPRGELKETLDAMQNDWRTIMKVEAKKDGGGFDGICALEVTTNERDETFHPHLHIIIEQKHAMALLNRWCEMESLRILQNIKISEKNKIRARKKQVPLKLHKVLHREKDAHKNDKTGLYYTEIPRKENGDLNIKEIFKYAVKLSVTNQNKSDNSGIKYKTIGSTPMLYEIAKSLQSVQQWRPFGNFRNAPNTAEVKEAISNEMIIPISEYMHIQLSKSWKWDKEDWMAVDIQGISLTGGTMTESMFNFLFAYTKDSHLYFDDRFSMYVAEIENKKSRKSFITLPSYPKTDNIK